MVNSYLCGEQKKKKMAKLIVKLKNRMELQMAKISEMEIEREALR